MLRGYSLMEARTTLQFEAARTLILEYAAYIGALLGVDLSFQNIEAELNRLPDMYGPPSGCLLLAGGDEHWVGCAALRRFSDGVCEMKRLYIKPDARGANLGRRLAENLVIKARQLGYRRIVLDTLENMTAARTLYGSLGFRETQPYYFNPMEGVSYMELVLETPQFAAPQS
jgi:ribosomal protein S18 acetylase RimI-like enzyme